MEEIRKDIPGFEGIYQVSSLANVRRLKSKGSNTIHLLKKVIHLGYETVKLQSKQKRIHRLIAQVFIPNPEKKPFINHKNGIRCDNRIENIERCTNQENIQHSFDKLGRRSSMLGVFGGNNHLSKGVIQKDLDGNILKTRLSQKDIERELGFNNTTISQCCTGKRKTYKGYIRERFIYK